MSLSPESIRPITKENPYKVVFVCLGNICRSPTGEGVFQHLVRERGLDAYFEIDSAGTTSYHVGAKADPRSIETAKSHGIDLLSISRKFEAFDLSYFDLILPMDQSNKSGILYLSDSEKEKSKVKLLREFDNESKENELDVPDPYYGGASGFENVFQMIKRSCVNLLDELETHIQFD